MKPGSEFFNKHPQVVQDMAATLLQSDFSSPFILKRFVDNLDGFQIDFFDNIQTRYFLDYRPDWVGDQELSSAIKNLGRFKTIGTTEKYNDYIERFCIYYGIQQRPRLTAQNPSKVKPLFDVSSQEVKTILSPLIRFDQKLYDHIIENRATSAKV